jgi:hypothetical protein
LMGMARFCFRKTSPEVNLTPSLFLRMWSVARAAGG